MNFGRARLRGEEWSARFELPGDLALALAHSWQSAIDLGPLPAFWIGKRLPGRPSGQDLARLEWHAPGRLELRAAAELVAIGDNVLDPYNQQRVPARRLGRVTLSFRPLRAPLRISLEGRNLGDSRAADVGGFPLPGRSVFVACDWQVVTHPPADAESTP